MREFILYSRTGRTDPKFHSLREAGRLDVVYQCILMSLFMSHAIRRDVVFHAILSGPPLPPLELTIDGSGVQFNGGLGLLDAVVGAIADVAAAVKQAPFC